ncbi:DUF1818 family protein [Pannus brasiliensis CCIBt3594]|uniref:DUF1818 family protein n=1 Tax=Pannus brasiliensis CCIBt3594 TaxID=1427578 RepID=A0AAW9QP74_9CHRO
MEKILKEGEGWRIGWNPMAEEYRGMIGGGDWAIELTEEEWNDFRRLSRQLSATMEAMKEELMDEERIACEAESDLLWLEVEGFPASYSLRLLLHRGRRCEGSWPPAAVAELLRAIDFF